MSTVPAAATTTPSSAATSAPADRFTLVLAQPSAVVSGPAQQFLHDLLTNAQLAGTWSALLANTKQAPLKELDQELDNWLAEQGYDCSVTDVQNALAQMKANDLAYWTGVYGTTRLAQAAGPPLIISGNGTDALTVDGIVIHGWTYADNTLRWTTAMNQTSGNLTFADEPTGTDGVIPGLQFAGTLTPALVAGSGAPPASEIYQGRIGPLPPAAETTGVASSQVAFSIINQVVNLVQAARILYRGGELAAQYGPKLLQAAQARLSGTPEDVEGESAEDAGAAEAEGEGGEIGGEGAAEGAGEAIGEATGEAIGEAAGDAAAEAAGEAAAEAGLEIGAAAAPEIAEGIGAAAAAGL